MVTLAAMAGDLALHPMAEQLAFLLGRWEGASLGLWAPGEPLEFRDVIEFGHVGKPFLAYEQHTWRADGTPSHGERGYLIATGAGTVEWALAQPSGILEALTGTVESGRVTLRTGAVARTAGAKHVTDVARDYAVDGDELRYELQIAMNGEPLAAHISGTLHRTA